MSIAGKCQVQTSNNIDKANPTLTSFMYIECGHHMDTSTLTDMAMCANFLYAKFELTQADPYWQIIETWAIFQKNNVKNIADSLLNYANDSSLMVILVDLNLCECWQPVWSCDPLSIECLLCQQYEQDSLCYLFIAKGKEQMQS